MNGNLNLKSPLLWIGILGFIAVMGIVAVYLLKLPSAANASHPLALTEAIMVGLALIVCLVIMLLIFFKAAKAADKTQALGLPSGSVRALLALILVLVFVGMGVYLYQGLAGCGWCPPVTVQGLTHDQVVALRAQFTVVLERPESSSSNPAPATGGGQPTPAPQQLYDVTYYPHTKEADDLAKQMFTQIATVFVTVIGFYFGSSTATSGVSAGVKAVTGQSDGTDPNSGVPAALQEAKALALDASNDLNRIQGVLTQIPDGDDKTTVTNLSNSAKTAFDSIQARLQAAIAAAAKFGTSTNDAENTAAANDVTKARDDIKSFAATIRKNADDVAAKASATPKNP